MREAAARLPDESEEAEALDEADIESDDDNETAEDFEAASQLAET